MRIICVDMEIGKFEYCNPLHTHTHTPVMVSLLRYIISVTYLSFIMYCTVKAMAFWIDAELQRVISSESMFSRA